MGTYKVSSDKAYQKGMTNMIRTILMIIGAIVVISALLTML
ncbi:hypothetical protein [Salipaludibacillus keqinensis]|nr:hypothetical protein [Salipaludibacillus keqinensis]